MAFFVPAIEAAGLEPYRVDKDPKAAIPVDTLHDEIRAAKICLADITISNPNVMYELGFAIASNKDVVLISSLPGNAFPFDIWHRSIIQYSSDSPSDFTKLEAEITERLKGLLGKQESMKEIISASPVKSTEGLQPHEIAAIAIIMANRDSASDNVVAERIKLDMELAGYTRLATSLALTRLVRIGFAEVIVDQNYADTPYFLYKLLPLGEDWLLTNHQKLELRSSVDSGRTRNRWLDQGLPGDDVPF